MRWTARDDAYLAAHAGDGARSIAAALRRSTSAVKTRASRLGLSLRMRWTCPNCGRMSYQPPSERTGFCRICVLDASIAAAQRANDDIRAEVAREKAEIRRRERKRQAIYASTSREKAKLRKIREERDKNATNERRG